MSLRYYQTRFISSWFIACEKSENIHPHFGEIQAYAKRKAHQIVIAEEEKVFFSIGSALIVICFEWECVV